MAGPLGSGLTGLGNVPTAGEPGTPAGSFPQTYSEILLANAVNIDVAVGAGDGEYLFDLSATLTGGGCLACTLRVNGAPLQSPDGLANGSIDGGVGSSVARDTAGQVLNTRSVFGATSVQIKGRISVRSGLVCSYTMTGIGKDVSRIVQFPVMGFHSPGSPLSSIGVTSDGTFATGSTLRVTRVAA